MSQKKLLKSVLIFSLFILALFLAKQTFAKVDINVTQEKRKPAEVKISADVEFCEVKIYRKIENGKFVLIYKAMPENVKTFECKIPIIHFSTKENRDFKIIVKDKNGNVIGADYTIEPIPEETPINPSETARPTSTSTPIPTKPTPTTTTTTSPSATTSPTQSPSTSPSPTQEQPDKVTKVLIIGNSYTYYNDLGGILTELGNKTGKKMVVVEATHGGYVPDQFASGPISGYYWDNREGKTKVVLNDGKTLNYNTNLKDVFKKDWANLNRAGKWDYIFFQNYVKDKSKIAEGDTKIFNIVKSGLSDSKHFIIIGTYYQDTSGKDRIQYHAKAARQNNTSVMDIADIMDGYGSNWRKECTITDGPKHPTATQQYLVATGMYSRIFGKSNLAKTTKDTNFIKLFNENGKFLKDVIASTDRSDPSKGQTKTANSVIESKAKKIQALIYKNYENYIMYDVSNTATKVLIIGNSYTYYNDLGGILAELGKKTNKPMVVVEATRGGKFADYFATGKLANYYWDNRGEKTKVVTNSTMFDYNKTLKQILKEDWASLDRSGEWDYIFLQNNADNGQVVEGDKNIFSICSSSLKDKKHFIMLGTYFRADSGKDRIALHSKAAKEKGFSVIDLADIYEKYENNWRKEFTINDSSRHPTATAQYFTATAMYAKIFGKDNLAKTKDDTNFIKLYNKSGNELKSVIAATTQSNKTGQTKTCQSITDSKAKKIQAIIYSNYEKYINYNVSGSTTPTSVNLNKASITQEIYTNRDLAVTLNPSSAQSKLTWSTSNKNVVQVTSNGRINAKGKGTAVVTVKTENGKTATCTIKVEEKGIEKKVISDITPTKTIYADVDKTQTGERIYATAQGMARVKANNGQWYYFCTIIKNTGDDRDTSNTLIYIIEEKTGNTVAKIKDYCYGHANGAAADENNIYVYAGQKKIDVISKNYITDAINKYNSNGKKIIKKDFSKNYVKRVNLNISENIKGASSIGYDLSKKKLYFNDNNQLWYLNYTGNEMKGTYIANFPKVKEELKNGGTVGAAAGLTLSGKYLLVSRWYPKGTFSTTQNVIHIYECTFDSKNIIKEINYKSSIIFGKSPIKDHEIECIHALDNNGNIISYHNSHHTADSQKDYIYFFNVSKGF